MVVAEVRRDRLVPGPGLDGEAPQGGERAERLATEAESGQRLEVGEIGQLGGVVLEREDLEVARRDAGAIVDDLEALLAVAPEGDLDAGGTGVEAVLDQLLDGRREVENHLAGADSVDGALVYGPYGGGIGRDLCRHENPSPRKLTFSD